MPSKTTKATKPAKASASTNTKTAVTPAKKRRVLPVPEGFRTVTPHLICAGAAAAIEFYQKAFGAVELIRLPAGNGKLMHACIRIGDSPVMLFDEAPEWGANGPKALRGSPVIIHLFVEDADALFARAVKAGATVKMPVTDMFWGDRYGQLVDPFGHEWSIATHQRDLSPEEILQAAKQAGPC
jgi:PhnB protein